VLRKGKSEKSSRDNVVLLLVAVDMPTCVNVATASLGKHRVSHPAHAQYTFDARAILLRRTLALAKHAPNTTDPAAVTYAHKLHCVPT